MISQLQNQWDPATTIEGRENGNKCSELISQNFEYMAVTEGSWKKVQ